MHRDSDGLWRAHDSEALGRAPVLPQAQTPSLGSQSPAQTPNWRGRGKPAAASSGSQTIAAPPDPAISRRDWPPLPGSSEKISTGFRGGGSVRDGGAGGQAWDSRQV